jgi:DNA-binding beta-propeller fold protein YncE
LRRYNDPNNRDDLATGLGVSPDGSRLFVTGLNALSGDSDYATVAYDAASGARLWVSNYDGPDGRGDWPTTMGVSPDGSRLFVTGQSVRSGGDEDYATVAYDAASGTQLWTARYNGPGNGAEWPHALGVSPDGSRLFVTGESMGSTSDDDYATLAYDAASGAQLWTERYNGPVNGRDFARALGVSPDGSTLFVTGGSWGTGGYPNFDYATVAYDPATGAELWTRRYDGASNGWDEAHALAVSPDGSRVFVTGQSWGSGRIFDYATVAYATR